MTVGLPVDSPGHPANLLANNAAGPPLPQLTQPPHSFLAVVGSSGSEAAAKSECLTFLHAQNFAMPLVCMHFLVMDFTWEVLKYFQGCE